MNSRHAVFLDCASLDLGDLDLSPLQQAFTGLTQHDASHAGQVVERLQGAQVAISNKVPLTAETLAALPDLKLILVAATGTNNVDMQAAQRLGISERTLRYRLADMRQAA